MSDQVKEKKKPNPGSDEARLLGCNCPVLDNNHGRWAPYPASKDGSRAEGWWTRGDCSLHGIPLLQVVDDE